MFKKLTLLAVAVLLTSCTLPSNKTTRTDGKREVLTTFTVLADIAKNVAGDAANVQSLTAVGAEIHGYEPTPGDIVRAQKANLILDNGLGLERWAEKLYASIPNVEHVTVSDGIVPMSIVEGPYQGKPNPHAWMAPRNALIYVENIRAALVKLDPPNEAIYNANANAYSDKIKAIDTELLTVLSSVPEKQRYLVSCEGAFTYLIRDYKMKELYLWPINADAQGTPQQVAHVIDAVKANKIPVVFCESTVSPKAQEQVASEAGAKFGGLLYVDSLSEANGPVPTYLDLLEYNAKTLVKGLTGKDFEVGK